MNRTAVVDEPSAMPYYREVAGECAVFEHCATGCLPLLLKGPTGCGKSRFVEAMAAGLGRPLITVACNDDTSSTDLVGRYLVRGGDTVWQEGPLTRAVREGAVLYLDEVAEAREDVIVVIHPLTDHRRELYIDKTGETLHAAASFMLVVSFNPGYQRRLKELKPSTRQRFVALAFDYPAPDAEAEIVAAESHCGDTVARRLVDLAVRIRRADELALAETASTRLLVSAAHLIAHGLPARRACRAAIVEPLSDDPEVRAALADLVALAF
jgi:nitric oxide reductase NorQ protein